MSKVIIMGGLPGSGKSTRAKEIAEKYGYEIFSSDAYRKKINGSEEDQSNGKLIFDTLYKDALQAVKDGKDIIFDSCNVSKYSIYNIMNALKGQPVEYIYWFMDTPLQECLERDDKRDRHVGESVINKFQKQLLIDNVKDMMQKRINDNGGNIECYSMILHR